LPLEGNIAATRQVADLAHRAGIACEGELGAVLGHEAGPLPDYEELFASGMGFTDVAEAGRFARESGCDWLSVAAGNVHGAISGALKQHRKIEAHLDMHRLEALHRATGLPLVLHGGSGIRQEDVWAAVGKGIAKINIGTEIRQAYESERGEHARTALAQQAVYERTRAIIQAYGHIVVRAPSRDS
jgi:fructose-bisphosphate aldolase class II